MKYWVSQELEGLIRRELQLLLLLLLLMMMTMMIMEERDMIEMLSDENGTDEI